MAENSDFPVLIIMEGEQKGQRWFIDKDVFVIGRGGECNLVLPERQVSREHIRIYRDGTEYYLQDLDSKNGTWINEIQLQNDTTLLRDGDEINIARAVHLTYVGSESTAPIVLEKLSGRGGLLQIERESRRVFISEKEVDPPLSLPQYRLLELLFDANGGVCTREAVIEAVWPDAVNEGVSEQAIDALVRRLRDRLSEIDPVHQFVVTVRGHGFRLDNPRI
jgi:hypothetical protein